MALEILFGIVTVTASTIKLRFKKTLRSDNIYVGVYIVIIAANIYDYRGSSRSWRGYDRWPASWTARWPASWAALS